MLGCFSFCLQMTETCLAGRLPVLSLECWFCYVASDVPFAAASAMIEARRRRLPSVRGGNNGVEQPLPEQLMPEQPLPEQLLLEQPLLEQPLPEQEKEQKNKVLCLQ